MDEDETVSRDTLVEYLRTVSDYAESLAITTPLGEVLDLNQTIGRIIDVQGQMAAILAKLVLEVLPEE